MERNGLGQRSTSKKLSAKLRLKLRCAKAVVAILNSNGAINAGLADPKFKSRFTDLGAETFAGSPADFGKFIVDYTEKWAKGIRAAGVKAE